MPDVKELHAKIGQLSMENDFLSVTLGRIESARQAMIDKEDKLPVTRQCEILDLNRSGIYYKA